jgi:LmbE family N-acetylglucosaminyl deacetylase
MPIEPSAGRALLAAFAHPDDETFAIGGTLARCAAEGVRTALFVATDGEAGSVAAGGPPDRATRPRVRRAELLRAAAVLDVARVFLPGFRDGAVDAERPDAVVAALVAAIRLVRPNVVITFGPEGAPNAHADHRAISRLATAAFFAAGNATLHPDAAAGAPAFAPRRLYYVAWDAAEIGASVESMPATRRIDVSAYRERKRLAFAQHATQQHHLAEFERNNLPHESYFLAAGRDDRA